MFPTFHLISFPPLHKQPQNCVIYFMCQFCILFLNTRLCYYQVAWSEIPPMFLWEWVVALPQHRR